MNMRTRSLRTARQPRHRMLAHMREMATVGVAADMR
jgi:hypothetical protein